MQTHLLADKASLSGVRRMIRADLNRVKADPSLAFDCLVAVTEACGHALLQSSEEEDDRPELSWDIDGEVARFFVRDCSSRGSSRASHPARGFQEQQDAEPLGLELMRGLMDDVTIEVGATGTTVSLVKYLQ